MYITYDKNEQYLNNLINVNLYQLPCAYTRPVLIQDNKWPTLQHVNALDYTVSLPVPIRDPVLI